MSTVVAIFGKIVNQAQQRQKGHEPEDESLNKLALSNAP